MKQSHCLSNDDEMTRESVRHDDTVREQAFFSQGFVQGFQ